MTGESRLETYLGWFSVGLGLAEVVATPAVARLVGLSGGGMGATLMRVAGVRELVAGRGILTSPRPVNWQWSRVAGDVMDLVLLGAAFVSSKNDRARVAFAAAMVAGIAVLDVRASQEVSGKRAASGGMLVRKSIIVGRSPGEVYDFWRDLRNLPRFMRHLESVEVTGEGRSRWRAKAPAGRTVEWYAEIVADVPREMIAWRSVEGSDVSNSGAVRFMDAPGGRGTLVSVEMQYDAPGGPLGVLIARFFREEPEQQVQEDLRVFKQVMETGQVTISDATVGETRLRQGPARPASRVA